MVTYLKNNNGFEHECIETFEVWQGQSRSQVFYGGYFTFYLNKICGDSKKKHFFTINKLFIVVVVVKIQPMKKVLTTKSLASCYHHWWSCFRKNRIFVKIYFTYNVCVAELLTQRKKKPKFTRINKILKP